MRILVVEDEPKTADYLHQGLSESGYVVDCAASGIDGLHLAGQHRYELVILDVNLPGQDGWQVLQQLRRDNTLRVMMLTARGRLADKIKGLDMGADDYVCKPVRPRLLLARINALLRRTEVPATTGERQRLQFGPLRVDNTLREAWLGDNGIELTAAEFDLLWLLVSNAGRILSREEIFTSLRGVGYDGQDRSIDVRISRIRPKIGDDPDHPRMIKTVRSKGYLFVGEAAQALGLVE